MASVEDLEVRVREAAARDLPALGESSVVLAASGGADSAALVALLCEADVIDRRRALIAHFDHRRRGEDAAARDLRNVRALAERFGVELQTGVWAPSEKGEAAARVARYAFLCDVAERYGAAAVLTGHTADDQAETVLMHAVRGAGLHGLSGMARDAAWPGGATALRLWRPLLGVWRDETRAYCDALGIAYSDDETNADRSLLRNRLRLDLIPQMEHALPDVRARLLELADGARAASAALDAVAARALVDAVEGDDFVSLDRARMSSLVREAMPHAFRLALARLLGDARDFERKHYATLERALDAATGSTFLLPRGVVATVDASRIILSVGAPRSVRVDPLVEHPLPFEGTAGAWWLRVVPAGSATMADGGVDLRMPHGAVVRARRPGDRVRTRAGGKKLADWYIDRKIPRRERESAPVIAYGNQVLWTPWGALGELPHAPAWRVISARAGEPAPATAG